MTKYTIPKYFHYSNFFPNILKVKDNMVFEKLFIFDDNCKYDIKEESCVNKLFGFCFGLFGVHNNSARFGWSYKKEVDKFLLWKYIYKDGKLYKSVVAAVGSNEKHKYTITVQHTQNSKYIINYLFDGNYVDTDVIKDNHKYILTLGPYFGGNTRAPHKMIIKEK